MADDHSAKIAVGSETCVALLLDSARIRAIDLSHFLRTPRMALADCRGAVRAFLIGFLKVVGPLVGISSDLWIAVARVKLRFRLLEDFFIDRPLATLLSLRASGSHFC